MGGSSRPTQRKAAQGHPGKREEGGGKGLRNSAWSGVSDIIRFFREKEETTRVDKKEKPSSPRKREVDNPKIFHFNVPPIIRIDDIDDTTLYFSFPLPALSPRCAGAPVRSWTWPLAQPRIARRARIGDPTAPALQWMPWRAPIHLPTRKRRGRVGGVSIIYLI